MKNFKGTEKQQKRWFEDIKEERYELKSFQKKSHPSNWYNSTALIRPSCCLFTARLFSPAGFEAFELLDEEVLQNLGTLVKRRVAGVVVPAVVEDFGHVCYELGQLDVLPLV